MSNTKTAAKAQTTNDADTELSVAEKKLLYSALTHLQGSINFAKVAADIGVPNAEAARKRLKRLLQKEQLATTIKGDRIGGGEEENGSGTITKASAKTPSKAKLLAATKQSGSHKIPGKKRKAAEMEDEQAKIKVEDQAEG